MDNHNSNKEVKNMTNDELLKAYKKGCKWTTARMQVTGTNKNELGQPYDHETFLAGLNRLEVIENELMERGVIYG